MDKLLAKFCRKFFVRFYEIYQTEDDAVNLGLGSFTQEEKKNFVPILDELIGPKHSDDDLVKLWRSSPADVWIADGRDIRKLFAAARKKIG